MEKISRIQISSKSPIFLGERIYFTVLRKLTPESHSRFSGPGEPQSSNGKTEVSGEHEELEIALSSTQCGTTYISFTEETAINLSRKRLRRKRQSGIPDLVLFTPILGQVFLGRRLSLAPCPTFPYQSEHSLGSIPIPIQQDVSIQYLPGGLENIPATPQFAFTSGVIKMIIRKENLPNLHRRRR